MVCNDPFLTYLKSFGYNVIRLPKTDVKLLQALSRNGKDLKGNFYTMKTYHVSKVSGIP